MAKNNSSSGRGPIPAAQRTSLARRVTADTAMPPLPAAAPPVITGVPPGANTPPLLTTTHGSFELHGNAPVDMDPKAIAHHAVAINATHALVSTQHSDGTVTISTANLDANRQPTNLQPLGTITAEQHNQLADLSHAHFLAAASPDHGYPAGGGTDMNDVMSGIGNWLARHINAIRHHQATHPGPGLGLHTGPGGSVRTGGLLRRFVGPPAPDTGPPYDPDRGPVHDPRGSAEGSITGRPNPLAPPRTPTDDSKEGGKHPGGNWGTNNSDAQRARASHPHHQ